MNDGGSLDGWVMVEGEWWWLLKEADVVDERKLMWWMRGS